MGYGPSYAAPISRAAYESVFGTSGGNIPPTQTIILAESGIFTPVSLFGGLTGFCWIGGLGSFWFWQIRDSEGGLGQSVRCGYAKNNGKDKSGIRGSFDCVAHKVP
jgi:hypothetical protein